MSEQSAADQFICDSDALPEGGRGLRFAVAAFGDPATGFVVRYDGQVYGYLNRCAHVPIELDWDEGQFFESSGLYLMCSTHGAVYVPETGLCAGGPCRGGRLRPIAVREENGKIYWQPDEFIRAPDVSGETGVKGPPTVPIIPLKPQNEDL